MNEEGSERERERVSMTACTGWPNRIRLVEPREREEKIGSI